MKYILAFDQGTTSSRAIVFDHQGNIKSVAQQEFEQIFPHSGWVEHNANEIWESQLQVAKQALAQAELTASDIAAVGITNQRETTVMWNRKTGEPIYNAIVWQDRRTADFCDQLKSDGLLSKFQEKTGLLIDSYFSGTKIHWLLENIPNARNLAEAGELAFGTIDTWLIWKLTNGQRHITDVSNASRTLIYNIHTQQWDEELSKILDIPQSVLPEVCASSEVYGDISVEDLAGIPVSGIAGDQQAALFGQACTQTGMAKNTYGTGCFMLMNTGTTPVKSKNQLLTTIAWRIGDVTEYALEGSVFVAGAVVQWLRDGLGLIKDSAEVEALAASVPDHGDVYVVPAFTGLGAPHWDSHARGTIVGLSRGSSAAHLARAALDSIAYQSMDLLKAMEADAEVALSELRVDGGATANNLLMQFQADVLQSPVIRPQITETTALGAAYLAGLAVGYWKDQAEIASQWQIDQTFEPQMSPDQVAQLRDGWNNALARAKG
jgi:glycerol kinase